MAIRVEHRHQVHSIILQGVYYTRDIKRNILSVWELTKDNDYTISTTGNITKRKYDKGNTIKEIEGKQNMYIMETIWQLPNLNSICIEAT